MRTSDDDLLAKYELCEDCLNTSLEILEDSLRTTCGELGGFLVTTLETVLKLVEAFSEHACLIRIESDRIFFCP